MRSTVTLFFTLFASILVHQGCTPSTASGKASLSEDIRRQLEVVPLPFSVQQKSQSLNITSGIYVVPALVDDQHAQAGVEVFIDRLKMLGVSTSDPQAIPVSLDIQEPGTIRLTNGMDESYRLDMGPEKIEISASNYLGINHGLTTLAQLLFQFRNEDSMPAMSIKDQPRYSWRGLMIDVSRHWIPKEIVLKCLDAMSLVKMNVLHLHLTDDQGFRIESRRFTNLHNLGSDGNYFTQADMSEIIRYASKRGIRVIPEFDIPGHTTSWLTAYPRLGCGSEQFELQKTYGIFPNVLNPVSDETFVFLDQLFEEMANLFPDEYIHIGADEVLVPCWAEDEQVQKFMEENELISLEQVHSYFILRVQQLLKNHGKKVIAWDDALRSQIANGQPIIQTWRDHERSFEATRMGMQTILSKGWYLDHKLPLSELYKIDPEYNPNAITTKPDSNNWQIWDLEVSFRGQVNDGRLVLFGLPPQQTGIIQIMGNSSEISNVRNTSEGLTFNFDIGAGQLNARLDMTEDSLAGSFKIALFNVPVEGHLEGGSEISGSSFPDFKVSEPLSQQQKSMILGGEACMWSEWVDEKNILSRIWPSAGAVAEKLWSPSDHTSDIEDLYRRMDAFRGFLLQSGIDYQGNQNDFVKNLSDSMTFSSLSNFVVSLEEVKYYDRWNYDADHTIDDAMNTIADAASPESFTSVRFGRLVDQLLRDGPSLDVTGQIRLQLSQWMPVYRAIEHLFDKEQLKSVEVLALALSDLAKISSHVMDSRTLTQKEMNYYRDLKSNALRKIDGVFLAPAPHMIRLIDSYMTEL